MSLTLHFPNGKKSFSLGLPRFREGLPQVEPVISSYPERVKSFFSSPTFNRTKSAKRIENFIATGV